MLDPSNTRTDAVLDQDSALRGTSYTRLTAVKIVIYIDGRRVGGTGRNTCMSVRFHIEDSATGHVHTIQYNYFRRLTCGEGLITLYIYT